jgi:hypothetical protein
MTQQTKISDTDEFDFSNNLVLAITGANIIDYEEDYQPTVVQKCTDAYTKFITDYVAAKFGEVDSLRLKSGLKFGEDVFGKFPDLNAKFEEAYNAFIQNLETQTA